MARGTIKFFNDDKGFGFIASEDGSEDLFVHISAVQAAGLHGLNEGDVVSFERETDRRSGRPSALYLERLEAAAPGYRSPGRSAQRATSGAPRRPSGEWAGSGAGVVKWFNPAKGFGFIQPRDGSADVFVHAFAVQAAGLEGLPDGQTIAFDLERDGRTGKLSAVNLKLG